ncbi:MAG: penicillin-binding protein 2 [Opitutaceae bacterium]|jgi:cell division protein FtsI/penicillin-binding protein 2|nr:penicillin-binding protein 2 [Opitutaceae bacterium]
MTARGFASHSRLYLVALVVVVCFGVVAHRLIDLHVIEREHFLAQIQDTRHRVVAEPARRGNIYDARGDLLATTKTDITLAVDPWALQDKIEAQKFPARMARYEQEQRERRAQLAELLGMTVAEVEALYTPSWRDIPLEQDIHDDVVDGRTRARFVKFREGVTEEQFAKITALRVAGLTHERRFRRVYPHRELAAHVIGFVNKEDVPSGGVEAFADQYLKGLSGWREIERDGKRVELAQYRQREVPASDGWGVTLSIDAAIQYIVEQELEAIVDRFKPQKATILVSDPHTGFLLALANYPSFDLNEFGTTPLDKQRNIAAADLVEPGSTFKIVATAGALNEGLVTPTTKFDCTLDSIIYNGKPRRFMRDDHRYPQPLTVAEVIAKSSNVGTAQLGMLLGDRRLYDYARAFGFGERSGYPLGREEPGLLADPSKWSGIDITRIPAGYSIAATPLQVHYGMGVIASGGDLMRPQVIRQVVDAQGEVVYTFKPAVRRTVLERGTAESMARMLQRVVSTEGTARVAVIPGYEVAGKTGTAQKLIDGRYSARNHIGSFVGFFPASQPRVLMTVIVDDGKPPTGGTAYGSVVAAPSFKRIAEQLIQYLDIKPAAPTSGPAFFAHQAEGGRR